MIRHGSSPGIPEEVGVSGRIRTIETRVVKDQSGTVYGGRRKVGFRATQPLPSIAVGIDHDENIRPYHDCFVEFGS
jgi:hypothetical protein